MTFFTTLAVDKNIKSKIELCRQSVSKYFETFRYFHQIFLSPQVKRWAIITYKLCIYELPHELLGDLRLQILGN